MSFGMFFYYILFFSCRVVFLTVQLMGGLLSIGCCVYQRSFFLCHMDAICCCLQKDVFLDVITFYVKDM